MAYFRGPIYIWPSHAHTHFWSAGGDDGWRESGWNARWPASPNAAGAASGVGLPQAVVDEFVVMRFAELVDKRLLDDAIARALAHGHGNGGCRALVVHAEGLRASFPNG